MSGERHFTMAALTAVQEIRKYINLNPDISAELAITTIQSTDSDFASVDFEAGIELHHLLPIDIGFSEPTGGLQAAIAFLIQHHLPLWSRSFRLGRRHVLNQLKRDEAQCFKSAGLSDDPPLDSIVDWWDAISQKFYASRNEELHKQGRHAERLSLKFERERLSALNPSLEPRWVAIEDNTIGYDILSYTPSSGQSHSKMIEVKSSTANPPVVVLSRNEWNTAIRLRATYVFHFWDLKNELLYEKGVDEIESHIPVDQGIGTWKSVDIPLKEIRRL